MTEPGKAVDLRPAPPRDPELDRIARVGQWLAASESGSREEKSRGMTAALRLYYAEQLGLPPQASSELSVINGRLFMGSRLLRGIAARRGYRVVRSEDSNHESCTAILYGESGEEIGRYTFTIQDAEKAKLVKPGSAWEAHPSRMLWHRAAKFVLDDYAPEVTLGLYDEDEIDEYVDDGTPPRPEPAAEDGDWEPVNDAADAPRETDDDRKKRLHRRLAVSIEKAETDAKVLLPEGHESWEDYSRFLAKEKFGVDSRADLNSEQLAEVVKLVEEQAVPF